MRADAAAAPKAAAVAADAARPYELSERDPVMFILCWGNVVRTLSVFCPGLCLLAAHVLLGYSLVSCVLHLAIVGLLAGAALTLWNHSSLSSERSRIAVPQITLAPASVAQALGALGTRLGGALQHYNALLTWQAPSDSARALLYAYLGTQLLWLLAPASLISAYLAAFVLVPVYVHYARGPWLRLRAERVAPACKHLVDVARGHLDFVLQSGTLGKVSLLVTLAFAAYALSDYLPLAQMLKVVCYVVVLCDLCAFLAKAKED